MQLKVKFTCFYEEEVRISLISEDNLFSVIKNKEINLSGNLSDSKIGTNEPITQRIFFLLERELKEENISKIDYKKLEEASNRAAFRLSSKF